MEGSTSESLWRVEETRKEDEEMKRRKIGSNTEGKIFKNRSKKTWILKKEKLRCCFC